MGGGQGAAPGEDPGASSLCVIWSALLRQLCGHVETHVILVTCHMTVLGTFSPWQSGMIEPPRIRPVGVLILLHGEPPSSEIENKEC